MRNRLPAKTKLANRGIISLDVQSCMAGWSQLDIYLSLASSLAPFGHQLGLRLACHRWILKTLLNILFSLLFYLIIPENVPSSYSLFDYYVFDWLLVGLGTGQALTGLSLAYDFSSSLSLA
jgi:hypothetical protein